MKNKEVEKIERRKCDCWLDIDSCYCAKIKTDEQRLDKTTQKTS